MEVQYNTEGSALVETYGQYPFEVESGLGMYVYSTAGDKFLDLYGGHAVCILGHSPTCITEAVAKQAEKMLFYSNLARIPIRAEAAAKLIEFAGSGHSNVFFCNSGGEANENAIKIAMLLTGRQQIIGFKGGFHGRTMLAMAASDAGKWHEQYQGRVGDSKLIEPNNITELAAITSETACVIVEPIQSIGGVNVMEDEFLKALRAKCDEVGALLIFDEVQTGMGRTGVPFVSGNGPVVADISTVSKGLGAGFPIGAALVTKEVAAGIKPGDLGSTFGGGPLAMAALMANIEQIQKDGLLQKASGFYEELCKQFEGFNDLVRIRGRGCLAGLEFGSHKGKDLQEKLFDVNIITGTCSNQNVVHLLPPLIAEGNAVSQLKEALSELISG